MLRKFATFIMTAVCLSFSAGCAGIKVVNPNEKSDQGTLMLDSSEGKLKLVSTYTCKMESAGNRFSATGKTENDARKEVLARCKDRTLISFCDSKKITCSKN